MSYLKIVRGFIFAIGLLTSLAYFGNQAAALSGSEFNASRIIDDSTFFATHNMNTGDIQNFLNAKVPTCDTNGSQPSGRSGYPTRADWGRANGVPPPYVCLKDYSQNFASKSADAYCGAITGGTKSAANIIFDVAQACGVSEQTLIVLLQKEQSLVTDEWPWPIQYRSATGYGCPDSAPCDSQYYGFFNQVYNAARQFKRYVQLPSQFNYAAGRTSFVAYNPNSSCGGTNLTLQNQATAALYNYTPYQPNAAALNNLYGTGDSCSAYGNRNFWRLFNDWFGPTSGNGFARVKSEDPNDLRQWVLYGSIKQHIPDSQTINAWGLQNTPLITMSANYLNNVATGPSLERLMRSNVDNQILYFVDNGKRYAVTDNNLLATWGLSGMVTSYVSRDLFNLPVDGGFLSFSMKSVSSATLYMTDGINGSGQRVIRPYQNNTVYRAWEGDTAFVTEISSDFFDTMNDAIGATLTHTKIVNNGKESQVSDGRRYSQPAPFGSLYPGTAQGVSNATYNRLPWRGTTTALVQGHNSPSVYLVDGGTKHHILWPNALAAWTPEGSGITRVNESFISLLTSGSSIGSYFADVDGQLYIVDKKKTAVPAALDAAYRSVSAVLSASDELMQTFSNSNVTPTGFVQAKGQPQIYLIDNSGSKRHLEWADKVTLWGGWQAGITVLSDYIVDSMGTAASPGIFVSDGTNNFVIEGGKKWSVSNGVRADWGLSSPQAYSDGTLNRLTTAGALSNNARDGAGGYYLFRGGAIHSTADVNIAQLWSIDTAPIYNEALIRYAGRGFMLTRVVRSTVPGDDRLFLIDKGEWYNIDSNHAANLRVSSAPAMRLNPSSAPHAITDWGNWVIKDRYGNYFVIDGGGRRLLPAGTIRNQWTQNGSLSVPEVSDGFISLLPYGGIIERSFQGSGPAVYYIENNAKRHILYPDLLHNYVPFARVSDSLLNVIPNGPNINQ